MLAWRVVGISGATNSGKTTLTDILVRHFPGSVVVRQDDFFRSPDSECHEWVRVPARHQNWECKRSLDFDSLVVSVGTRLLMPPPRPGALLIVEGHIIFNHLPLDKLFHRRYFLTLGREECSRRRALRVYNPPDIPGYFEKCIWPMYLSNLDEVRHNSPTVMYLDGETNQQTIRDLVLADLNKETDRDSTETFLKDSNSVDSSVKQYSSSWPHDT